MVSSESVLLITRLHPENSLCVHHREYSQRERSITQCTETYSMVTERRVYIHRLLRIIHCDGRLNTLEIQSIQYSRSPVIRRFSTNKSAQIRNKWCSSSPLTVLSDIRSCKRLGIITKRIDINRVDTQHTIWSHQNRTECTADPDHPPYQQTYNYCPAQYPWSPSRKRESVCPSSVKVNFSRKSCVKVGLHSPNPQGVRWGELIR